MKMVVFDHVVVGAGIVGSCAALQLAKTGKKVLLIEQFSLPHTRGSSHGSSRLILSCYSDKFFAKMMPLALGMWKELEESSGNTLTELDGVLCLSRKSETDTTFSRCRANMLAYSPDYLEELGDDPLEVRYPMLRFGSDYEAFLDRSGGAILANKALNTVQALFKASGGELWDGCTVFGISPGSEVKVVTSRAEVTCKSVIVCAGAWTGKLLRESLNVVLPLQPAAVQVYYWREREPGTHSSKQGFKSFMDVSDHYIYGFPTLEYPGLVKVAVHGGSACDPDARDKAPPRLDLEAAVIQYVKDHLPGLEPEPAIVEKCMYTLTPDEVFIVDVLPDHKNIVVGCGFSGAGFKTSPIIGKLLGELATGAELSCDISSYSLSRFK